MKMNQMFQMLPEEDPDVPELPLDPEDPELPLDPEDPDEPDVPEDPDEILKIQMNQMFLLKILKILSFPRS
jgi:hypothetical protein